MTHRIATPDDMPDSAAPLPTGSPVPGMVCCAEIYDDDVEECHGTPATPTVEGEQKQWRGSARCAEHLHPRHETMFGLPGAEHVQLDPVSVFESQIDPYIGDDTKGPWTIEEWAMKPITFGNWAAQNAAEAAVESLYDEIDETAAEQLYQAAKTDDVLAAFQKALDLLASKTGYMMCDKKIAEHTLTLDADGEPLLNGERMYPGSTSTS
jgi:hypothetical protein